METTTQTRLEIVPPVPKYCAWCCQWFAWGVVINPPVPMPVEVSHGICASCADALMREAIPEIGGKGWLLSVCA
jgi:hypothetical protein